MGPEDRHGRGETRTSAGKEDQSGPLRKVAACAVLDNPYARRGYVEDLQQLVDESADLGKELGTLALSALASSPHGYVKAAIAGVDGDQEHGKACITSVFGDSVRRVIGGGDSRHPLLIQGGSPGYPNRRPIVAPDR